MLRSLSHHELLVFWTQLLALFAVARLLGAAARRVGLPSVVGELSAGLLLGPSVFGVLWPGGFDWFLPSGEYSVTQSAMILAVSWFGAAFLLVVAGFETDLDLITRLGRAALLVTLGSVLVPLLGGLVVGWVMPTDFYGSLDGNQPSRLVFALFVAATVAVSALAVVAKILSDLGLMRRDVGQITIAAGMANDLIGWVILGIIAGLAASGELSVGQVLFTVSALAAFMFGALSIGQRVVDRSLRYVRRNGRNVSGALTVIVATMLVFGVITQAIGVEAVLGAFVAGVILTRSRFQQHEAEHLIEELTSVLFAPLFFATAGLRLDLSLLRGTALLWALILLGVALILKFTGSFLGARFAGLTAQEGLVLGSGLNARGALEIIIATVGLSLGVFNQTTFTIIVMIPLVTSLLASIGLRVFSRGLEGSVAERERLAREAALDSNLLVRNSRLLVPYNAQVNSLVAAQVGHFAWPPEVGATVMRMNGLNDGPDLDAIDNVLFGRAVEVAEIQADGTDEEMAAEIVAQSRLGYGVITLGAREEIVGGQRLPLSGLVTELLRQTEVPVVLVRKAMNHPGRLPGAFGHALLPVVGSASSRGALELAANLSANLGTKLTLSHVIYQPQMEHSGGFFGLFRGEGNPEKTDEVAERLLDEAHDYVVDTNAAAEPEIEIRYAGSPGLDIVRHAGDIEADLIIVGAQLRRLEEARPSLGPNVEHILDHAEQTVVVVVTPDSLRSNGAQ